MSQVVPDFCWPTTKKTGVWAAPAPSPLTLASSLFNAEISAFLVAMLRRAPRPALDLTAPVAPAASALALRSTARP